MTDTDHPSTAIGEAAKADPATDASIVAGAQSSAAALATADGTAPITTGEAAVTTAAADPAHADTALLGKAATGKAIV